MSAHFTMIPCAMAGVEAVQAESDRSFPRHFHEQFGIGVIEAGAQKSLSGRGVVEAGPGHTITVNPGEVHDGKPYGGDRRAWRMLYIDPSLVSATLADLTEGKISYGEFSSPALRDTFAASCFRNLFNSMTGQGDGMEREQQLLILLAQLIVLPVARTDAFSDAKPVMLQAREMMDDDPARDLSLADLSEATSMSRFQFLRAFSRATGLTPHAYLVQRRVQLARKLIASGTSLTDAAGLAGFADQSHMTRHFIRALGISPGIYAANVRKI